MVALLAYVEDQPVVRHVSTKPEEINRFMQAYSITHPFPCFCVSVSSQTDVSRRNDVIILYQKNLNSLDDMTHVL